MTSLSTSTSANYSRQREVDFLSNNCIILSHYLDVSTDRAAIKDELAGRMVFDNDSVFLRLGIHKLSADLADACTASMKADPEFQKAREELERLLAHASRKSGQALDDETFMQDEEGGSSSNPTKPTKRERAMYGLLVSAMAVEFLFYFNIVIVECCVRKNRWVFLDWRPAPVQSSMGCNTRS